MLGQTAAQQTRLAQPLLTLQACCTCCHCCFPSAASVCCIPLLLQVNPEEIAGNQRLSEPVLTCYMAHVAGNARADVDRLEQTKDSSIV